MCSATKMMLSKERSPWTRSYLWSVRNAWATCVAIFKRSYNVNLALSVLLWNNLAKVPYEQSEHMLQHSIEWCQNVIQKGNRTSARSVISETPLSLQMPAILSKYGANLKSVVCWLQPHQQGEILLVWCTCTSVTFPLLRLNFARGRRGYPIR